MTFQESILTNVLCKIGILHGIAKKNLLLGALRQTHPECKFELLDITGSNDMILVYDCYDFCYRFHCYVNNSGYIDNIESII